MTWIEWYGSLVKPSWTPAPSTISLIWMILYPIILVSFGFVFVQAFRGKLLWRIAVPFAVLSLLAGWPVVEPAARAVYDDGRSALAAGAAGHVFNLGHGVPPDTDPDVLTRIVAHVHGA